MIHLNATIFKNQITPRVTGTYLGLILWDEVRAYTNRILRKYFSTMSISNIVYIYIRIFKYI